MLIASDFKDYYDTAQIHGVDKTCVYNRRTSEVQYVGPHRFYSSEFPNYIDLSQFVIGFCGKFYPGIRISNYPNFNEFFYSSDSCLKFLKKHNIGLKSKYLPWGRGAHLGINHEKSVVNFYSYDWKSLENIFLQHKIPVFMIGSNIIRKDYNTQLVISPCLRNFKFAKIKDPTSAFQEIYMYLSGVIGNPEKPIIEISDKYKQQQHGHDHKYSFRKAPSK